MSPATCPSRKTGIPTHHVPEDGGGRKTGRGIAHDFNNLLTAIIGYSKFLDARFPRGRPVKRDIGEIRKAADHAASLTHQLLAYSRKQILQPRVIGINSVVSEVDRMLRRLIGEDIDLVTKAGRRVMEREGRPGTDLAGGDEPRDQRAGMRCRAVGSSPSRRETFSG